VLLKLMASRAPDTEAHAIEIERRGVLERIMLASLAPIPIITRTEEKAVRVVKAKARSAKGETEGLLIAIGAMERIVAKTSY